MGPVAFSTIDTLPGLALRPSTSLAAPGPETGAAGADFGSVLTSFAEHAATSLRAGEAAAISGVQGTLPLQTVVERMMAAERTLQAAIGVRDKLVSSYLEISRMQI
jgi:flagellar hook-basal body complex protein FliE